MSHRHGHGGNDGGWLDMVPPHLDFGATSPFINGTLFSLLSLSSEPSVQQYLHANPESAKAILELSRIVGQAGIRVREVQGPKIIIDENIKYYSAEEVWMFDLAIDVVAMLATNGGSRSDLHGMIISDLRSIDKHAHSRQWRHQVHKAGAGPEQFRQLRELIPHHQPLG